MARSGQRNGILLLLVLWVLAVRIDSAMEVVCDEGEFSIPFRLVQHEELVTGENRNSHNGTTHRNILGGVLPWGRSKKAKQIKTAHVSMKRSHAVGSITLGNDQTFEVLFDSGSKPLWVFGKDIDQELLENLNRVPTFKHSYYDQSKSNTGELIKGGSKKRYRYGDGFTASGPASLDTVNVGGITLEDEIFYAMDTVGFGDKKNPFTEFDGILGLGNSNLYSLETTRGVTLSIFTRMVMKKRLKRNVFSVYMSKNGKTGQITFGGWDKRYFKKKLQYIDIVEGNANKDHHWLVRFEHFRFAQLDGDRNGLALFDTGASHVFLPTSFVEAIVDEHLKMALDSEHPFYGFVACDARQDLPMLEIQLGKKMKYELSGLEYTAEHIKGVVTEDGVSMCELLVAEVKRPMFTLGEPFIRKYYTVFVHSNSDRGNRKPAQIGLVKAIHPVK